LQITRRLGSHTIRKTDNKMDDDSFKLNCSTYRANVLQRSTIQGIISNCLYASDALFFLCKCNISKEMCANNFNHAKTILRRHCMCGAPKILTPSYRGISIRYFYYVRTTLFGRPVVLGDGNQYKGLVNSAIQLVSGELVFLLPILLKLAWCMLKIWIC
jgi:hypothetical protein